MRISVDMLADKLSIDSSMSKLIKGSQHGFQLVRLLLPEQKTLEADTATVVDPSQLSTLEYIDQDCLIISPGPSPINLPCSVLVTHDTLAETYSASIAAIGQYTELDARLKDSLLHERSISQLTEILAEFMKNIVQVLDPAFHVIAGYHPMTDDQGQITGYFEDLSSFPAATMYEMSRSNLLLESYQIKTARLEKTELFSKRAIVSNLYHEDHFLGKLLVIESTTELTEGAVDLVNEVLQYFVYMMQKHEQTINISLHTTEYFISENLKGNINDADFILTQIALLGWNRYDRYAVLEVYSESPVLNDFLIEIIRTRFSDLIAFPADNCVVAIMRVSAAESDLESRITAVLAESNLRGGISEPFADFLLARYHYIQANIALEAAIKLNQPQSLSRYPDQAINHLFLLTHEKNHNPAFIHPAIPLIDRYDRDNHAEYLITLETYLSCGFNQVEAARRLHIHRKSLQYRLTRLAKIADINLDDPQEQIRLNLSIQFHKNNQMI